jgi:hypothetical protein
MARDSIRGETIQRDDSRCFCNRCEEDQHEDLLHLLGGCSASQEVWDWVRETLIKAGNLNPNFVFTSAQVLLGAKFTNGGHNFPLKLWEVLRRQALWEIWKSFLDTEFHGVRQTAQTTIAHIWSRICSYMMVGWTGLLGTVRTGKMSIDKAKEQFKVDFGSMPDLVSFVNNKLCVNINPFGVMLT